MNNKKFTEHLLKVAFSAMVCDSHVDSSEMDILRKIEKEDFYFKEFDLNQQIEDLLSEFKIKGLRLVSQTLNDLTELGLEESQKIIFIYCMGRIMD